MGASRAALPSTRAQKMESTIATRIASPTCASCRMGRVGSPTAALCSTPKARSAAEPARFTWLLADGRKCHVDTWGHGRAESRQSPRGGRRCTHASDCFLYLWPAAQLHAGRWACSGASREQYGVPRRGCGAAHHAGIIYLDRGRVGVPSVVLGRARNTHGLHSMEHIAFRHQRQLE